MSLEAAGATAAVGAIAVAVAVWGARLSIGASRRGPGWARDHLERWRRGPWFLALLGIGTMLAVSPVWVGLGVLYIALVAGILLGQVRRRLATIEEAYGPFDSVAGTPASTRKVGAYLLVGGVVLALLAGADLAVRGWSGLFSAVLAGVLLVAGLLLRRG